MAGELSSYVTITHVIITCHITSLHVICHHHMSVSHHMSHLTVKVCVAGVSGPPQRPGEAGEGPGPEPGRVPGLRDRDCVRD